ncbi:GNAT family N-acetyltransferase [Enterococcus sp. CSURQ0835]|uniref:GNAT family N-acetyltransferase n=1 Tax=Enterococcus sp. CSURQ0835 TaxID=2681394 RepID=UPI001357EF44|nr:GNAT family N-acetyltransferase [Enterococcus sp. CSURQ0835]
MTEITFRPMQPRDFSTLLDLVIDTWQYRTWVPAPLVEPMADYFLCDMLERSSTITVALVQERVVGVIAYSTDIQSTAQQMIAHKRIAALRRILNVQAPENVFTKFIETMELDEQLLSQQQKKYDGTINLFIVHQAYAGRGIGSTMYQQFQQHMRSQQKQNFYLFTDSSSNFQFYEHHGLKKIATAKYDWGDETEEYYLYEGKLVL